MKLSHYPKRMALASIYLSTELFMLSDTSPSHAATLDFLDRRLADAQTLNQSVTSLSRLIDLGIGTAKGVWNSRAI